MKIFPLKDDETDLLVGFEIENAFIGRTELISLLEKCDRVSKVDKRGGAETIVAFDYRGKSFTAEEPYGDSSRFWIGPSQTNDSDSDVKTKDIMALFASFRPSRFRWILGNLILLRFSRLFSPVE
jgi:hypothetical protein